MTTKTLLWAGVVLGAGLLAYAAWLACDIAAQVPPPRFDGVL